MRLHKPLSLVSAAFCVLSACGGGNGSSSATGVSTPPAETPVVVLPSSCAAGTSSAPSSAAASVAEFAGNAHGPGNADGISAAASFNTPSAAVLDSAGNVYVTDQKGIRKITPAGVVTTWYAAANLSGIAIDQSDNLYITFGNSIRRITPAGVVSTVAGVVDQDGSTDGVGDQARFRLPTGLAVDSAGNLIVADSRNHLIRKVTPAGLVTTLAGSVSSIDVVDGVGVDAHMGEPDGVAADGSGNVYVTDAFSEAVRKITSGGVVTTWAGALNSEGNVDGIGSAARFNSPDGLASDAAGNVYVADSGNRLLRKISSAGVVTAVAGSAGINVVGSGVGLAVDSVGNIFIANVALDVVQKLTPAGVLMTLAGSAVTTGTADGIGSTARFNDPAGIATDSAANVYVADRLNSTIRKIAPDGAVSTLAGAAGLIGDADGSGAGAGFIEPTGVTVDSAGNLYVSDGMDLSTRGVSFNTYRLRKVTPAGVVTTLASTGAPSYASAVDSLGNIYLAALEAVLKVSPTGQVTVLAGNLQGSGNVDGVGPAVRFSYLSGLALDTACNVYVAEQTLNTIRKITPAGVVTTVAGSAGAAGHADGVGTAATFNHPAGLATDSADNLYIADRGNFTIRKMTPEGVVSTVAGVAGVGNVLPGPLPAQIEPEWIAFSGRSLYMTSNNGVVVIRNLP